MAVKVNGKRMADDGLKQPAAKRAPQNPLTALAASKIPTDLESSGRELARSTTPEPKNREKEKDSSPVKGKPRRDELQRSPDTSNGERHVQASTIFLAYQAARPFLPPGM